MAKRGAKKEFAPGLPVKGKITPFPVVDKPEAWEFSAHPHAARQLHIDMRLGNPATGIAHSFVLPKAELPQPGKIKEVIPTSDHTVGYMDFTGEIARGYGAGKVLPGRRTVAEVYHSDPSDAPGTKLRFNLYEADHPQEYAMVRKKDGRWILVNKTLTRERRPDIPDFKPSYKDSPIEDVGVLDDKQVLMPKLDGAHALVDLQAGRSPRLFSFRVGKKSGTGLIEHTHKVPRLLEKKVPKELDGTILRAEIVAVKDGRPLRAEQTGGLLNAKVWKSRRKQEEMGARLQVFPFGVARFNNRDAAAMPYEELERVISKALKAFPDFGSIPVARTPKEKIELLNQVKSKQHPLTEEGVVSVEPGRMPVQFTKHKIVSDYDVHVRGILPAQKKGGGFHDRAGKLEYSWTPDGPIVGTVGGFRHEEARDMLRSPEKYVGRVIKVEAAGVFPGKGDQPGKLRSPRFSQWHLDKGDIEKGAEMELGEVVQSEISKVAGLERIKSIVRGAGDVLGGANVERALQKYHARALEMPVIQSYRRDYPRHMGTTEDFLRDVLRGKKQVPWVEELPRQTKGRVKLVKMLERGAGAVSGEQKRTRRARRIATAAVGTPLALAGTGTALSKEGAVKKPKSKVEQVAKAVVPAAAGAAVGTAPIIQGLQTGGLGLPGVGPGGKEFKTVEELRKNLQKGDILLTSAPGRGGKWKPMISALGGDPFGYHIENVESAPRGKKFIEYTHSTPGGGGGGAVGMRGTISPEEDVIIRRFRKPEQVKEFLKNIKSRREAEEVLEELAGTQARSTMYDAPRAARSAARSYLPSALQKLIPGGGAVSRGAAVCSSLPGMASPVCFVPGVEGADILPHHVRRTRALQTVGSYRAARTLPQMAFERMLQVAPWAIRGAVGAGLGYGAYRGAQALMD